MQYVFNDMPVTSWHRDCFVFFSWKVVSLSFNSSSRQQNFSLTEIFRQSSALRKQMADQENIQRENGNSCINCLRSLRDKKLHKNPMFWVRIAI